MSAERPSQVVVDIRLIEGPVQYEVRRADDTVWLAMRVHAADVRCRTGDLP